MAESDDGIAIEVDKDGELVWKFVCPYIVSSTKRAAIVQMKRYSRDFIASIQALHN